MQQAKTLKKQSRAALVAQLMESMMTIGRTGHGSDGGKLLQTHGFSLPQLPMLFHLSMHEDGVSIKEIAARLNITSSAATQLVQTLLRRGVLRKTQDPTDGRAVRISLTPFGKKEFAKFKKGMLSKVEHSFSAVPDTELEEMIAVFQKIIVYMKPLTPSKE